MSKELPHELSLEDRRAVEEAEQFTVEQWQLATQDWSNFNATFAAILCTVPEETRRESAKEITRMPSQTPDDESWLSFAARLVSLSDSALGRLHQALVLNGKTTLQ